MGQTTDRDSTAGGSEVAGDRPGAGESPSIEPSEAVTFLRLQRDLGVALTSARTIDQAFSLVLDALTAIPTVDCAGIFLVDPATGQVELSASRGLPVAFVEAAEGVSAGRREISLLADGAARYGDVLEVAPSWLAVDRSESVRATALLPVQHKSVTVAVISLASRTTDEIPEHARHVVEAIASSLGGLIVRVRAEQERDDSRQALSALFEAVDDFLFITDEDGRFLQANPAMIEALGYDAADIHSMQLFDLLRVDRQDRRLPELKPDFQRQPTVTRAHWLAKSGDHIPAETHLTFGRRSGRPVIFGVSRSLLDRRRWQEKLRARDRILESVSESAGTFLRSKPLDDSVVTKALAKLGEATEVSRVYLFESHRGRDGTALTSQRYEWVAEGIEAQLDNPDLQSFPWREGGMGRWLDTFGRGAAVSGHVRSFPPSEQAILVPQGIESVLAMPIHVGGRLWGFIGFDECVREREWSESEMGALKTASAIIGAFLERREAELELRRLQAGLEERVEARTAELAAAVEQLRHEVAERERAQTALRESEAMYRSLVERSLQAIVLLQDNRIIFTNQAFADISGYPVEHLMELSVEQFLEIIHPNDRAMVLDRLQKRLAGEPVSPMYSYRGYRKDGALRWVEMLATRVEYQGQPAIQAAIVDITDRKRAEEERLRAQKLESVGVLAGGIAHDFNNLLLAILGNIDMARLDLEGAEEMLAEAERATLQAQSLTQQLLTFSRGGSPVRQISTIPTIVRDAAQFALSGSNTQIELELPEELWPVEIDPGQIGQVISNLVINADQAMPGGGLIRVRAENVTSDQVAGLSLAPGKFVRIGVEDVGIGMQEDHLGRIFDPYFTTKQGGTGLGLSVAHAVVAKHRGHISVRSQPGQGSLFFVYLPAAEDAPPPPVEPTAPPPVMRARILVVDDDPSIRRTIRRLLTRQGFDCQVTADGAAAVAAYKSAREGDRPFDLVILDLTIRGGMGGRETIARLLHVDPDVKAIVSSGYSNDPIMADYAQYGFRGVVAKPYRPDDLYRLIGEVLSTDEVDSR